MNHRSGIEENGPAFVVVSDQEENAGLPADIDRLKQVDDAHLGE